MVPQEPLRSGTALSQYGRPGPLPAGRGGELEGQVSESLAGGPRAGAILGGSVGSPRWVRIRCTGGLGARKAMLRMSAPPLEHTSGSDANSRASSIAQRERAGERALGAGTPGGKAGGPSQHPCRDRALGKDRKPCLAPATSAWCAAIGPCSPCPEHSEASIAFFAPRPAQSQGRDCSGSLQKVPPFQPKRCRGGEVSSM